MKNKFKPWLERLASVKLTIVCLALAILLVLIGTLAQVNMGAFAAQKAYFNSWWVYAKLDHTRLPVFPGGLLVGALWLINLTAAFIAKFSFQRKDTGILISHFGVILLLLGQLSSQLLSKESNMAIEVGQTRNYSESLLETELAVVETSNPQADQVTSIPYSKFSRVGTITAPSLPFQLAIRKFYANAELAMGPAEGSVKATQGIGTRVQAKELPTLHSDDEINVATAWVEILEGDKSRGVWLVSSGLGAPQTFISHGRTFELYLRQRRTYYPFSLTLKEFKHDQYEGTDIPKNFSSVVQLSQPEKNELRDVLIYMNHPLRYEGKTFYQASFGKGDRLSVFQVVDNPAAWAPYVSCLLVILGLTIQFLWHLLRFLRK